jgi:nickel/cobalt exporter
VRRPALRLAVVAGVAAAVLAPSAAWAHPLGNFSVNTADRLVVDAQGVAVTHVIDLAEIPTVQLRGSADGDGSGDLSPAELTAHAQQECASVTPALALVVDGRPAALSVVSATGETRPGQAGLTTTRVVCELRTDERPSSTVSFTDTAGASRNGWREVTAVAACGTVEASDVPADSPSQLLLAYPEESLAAPLDVRSATLRVTREGGCRDSSTSGTGTPGAAAPRGVDRLTAEFSAFVGREDLGLLAGAGALLLSVLFGCLHALAPGHGKTVMAAYLVGTRGTRRQALALGAFVTVSHTASVLLLGLLINLGTLVAPERVVPVTEVLSGALLAGIGLWLLTGAVRRLRATPDHVHHDDHGHPHEHDHPHPHPHPHEHEHPHEHPHPHPHEPAAAPAAAVHSHGGRAHSHAPPPDRPLTWRSLATMGVASGLVPSPSVLVVLLGATALGRAPFGVLLVLGYGLGMAATLVAAGLLLLRAQDVAERRGWRLARTRRLGRVLPALTAGVVVLLGIALAVRGVGTAAPLL